MCLRLGFYYHNTACRDTNGQVRVPGPIGRYIDSLAGYCSSVVCFFSCASQNELSQMDHVIQSPNVEWVDLGPAHSAVHSLLLASKIVRPVVQHRPHLDVMLIRGPSLLLPDVAFAAGNVPVTLLLVGDYISRLDDLTGSFLRRKAIRMLSYWNQYRQDRVAQHSLTIVNSRHLYEQLRSRVSDLHETRTTTLGKNDFYERDDTCAHKPYHLLFTGRMDHTKGVRCIIEAVAQLIAQGEDVVLDLVGPKEKNDGLLDNLQHLVIAKGIEGHVIYHGFKPLGPELFQHYIDADIYIIASVSEGFPRTVWEAMAHSVPVIATSVGSIPFFLKDKQEALLVRPRDSYELAEAISRVIHDRELRRRLIRNGFNLARANTLDKRAAELINLIFTRLSLPSGEDSISSFK